MSEDRIDALTYTTGPKLLDRLRQLNDTERDEAVARTAALSAMVDFVQAKVSPKLASEIEDELADLGLTP